MSPLVSDHVLAYKVWSARENGLTTQFGDAFAKARFLLLGEVHDNPEHHQRQAVGIMMATRRDLTRGAVPITRVALEMLSEAQKPGLEAFAGQAPAMRTHENFSRAVDWDKSGWPPFEIYAPIIKTALDNKLEIVAASPSRARAKAVGKDAKRALGEVATARLGLDQPLEAKLATALDGELVESHCGLLPPEALGGMAAMQRFRDAVMADSLLGQANEGAILIAGNGHVRRDRGVPLYLERRGVKPDDILAVMHVEVEDGKTDPALYVPRAPDGTAAADYVWFTPRQERPDPCEEMRRGPGGRR